MDKVKNLHDVSAVYFFILAFVYVILALAFRNNIEAELMIALMKILDIPFALIALIYGGTTLTLQLESNMDEQNETLSPWVIAIFTGCLVLFAVVVFINFAFPSAL